jgi:hypothetical protein
MTHNRLYFFSLENTYSLTTNARKYIETGLYVRGITVEVLCVVMVSVLTCLNFGS